MLGINSQCKLWHRYGSEGKFKANPTQYKLEPLAWFFINILESSLADIEIYRKQYNNLQKLSESASTVLNCFRSSPGKRLKVGDIVEKTGLPRRTVQYALKTLTKQELLQILGRGAGSRYTALISEVVTGKIKVI